MLEGTNKDGIKIPKPSAFAKHFSAYWTKLGLAALAGTASPNDFPDAPELAPLMHDAGAALAAFSTIPTLYLLGSQRKKIGAWEAAVRELERFDKVQMAQYLAVDAALDDAKQHMVFERIEAENRPPVGFFKET